MKNTQRKICVLLAKIKELFYIEKQDFLKILSLSILCAFLDLITKHLMFASHRSFIFINDFLNFIKVRNYGISFGLFDDRTTGMKMFIILFDILVVLYILTMVKTKNTYKKPKLFLISLAMIIGGAIGNMIDRLIYGSVRDFIDCHIKSHHWATFNVADIFVCVGVGFWIMCELFYRKKETKVFNRNTKKYKK